MGVSPPSPPFTPVFLIPFNAAIASIKIVLSLINAFCHSRSKSPSPSQSQSPSWRLDIINLQLRCCCLFPFQRAIDLALYWPGRVSYAIIRRAYKLPHAIIAKADNGLSIVAANRDWKIGGAEEADQSIKQSYSQVMSWLIAFNGWRELQCN